MLRWWDSVGVGLLRFSRNIDRGCVDFVLWRKKVYNTITIFRCVIIIHKIHPIPPSELNRRQLRPDLISLMVS